MGSAEAQRRSTCWTTEPGAATATSNFSTPQCTTWEWFQIVDMEWVEDGCINDWTVFADHCPPKSHLLPLQGYEAAGLRHKASRLHGKSHRQHKFIWSLAGPWGLPLSFCPSLSRWLSTPTSSTTCSSTAAPPLWPKCTTSRATWATSATRATVWWLDGDSGEGWDKGHFLRGGGHVAVFV